MSKLPLKTSLVTFKVLAGGKEIDSTYDVFSIRVVKEANKIPFAQVAFLDGDASTQDFETSNAAEFEPGKEMEIKLGYHNQEQTIYKGLIVGQKLKVREGRPSLLVVECKDKIVKATIGRKNRYFLKSKDSDMIQTLLGEYGVSSQVGATSPQHKEVIQYYSTDWDFILMRAEKNGLIVLAEDGKVSVKKPELSAAPKLTFAYGDDIYEMEVDMDATSQLKGVSSSAWDFSTQKVVKEDGAEPSVNKQGNLDGKKLADVTAPAKYEMFHAGELETGELKAWADARLLKSRLAKIRGWVIVQGNNEISLGDVIELQGVGKRFKGNAFVSGIRHDVSEGNWRTYYQLGLSDEWFSQNRDVSEVPAAGLMPGVTGLQTGTVQKLEKDPDGEFRIQVKLPMVDEKGEGVWARLARFYASNSIGAFFMPELQDEVIVGFVNDDPRFPVILGMLHSKKLPAPLTPEDKNPRKALVTKSKLTLSFDDEDKIVEITTPGKNTITISDKDKSITIEDQNKNKVALTTSGITLDSPKDIEIKAKGNITIQANGNITTKATGNVSVQGTNVTNKANAKFEASGNAGADLKTSAIATIQGTLVKIN
ncbi:MAG: type VI secretion system tip protein VgrG [Phaeodactylibacter sp.]|nr:type VI secretion system tip protein VgrG [Phaeodactylibacter sp.]MCB9296404.1 type VI secretion system tip protein VgrG [Lewinellaceae bacterium]